MNDRRAMSSLLSLHAPVPETTLRFEQLFFGDYTLLIRLSQLRTAAAKAARSLDADDATAVGEHVDAIDAYAQAWRSFAREYVYDAGSDARSRLPLEFAWRVQLLSSSQEALYRDGSPLFETACSTLALVAALQRRGAVDSRGHHEDLQRAQRELVYLREAVLKPLYTPRVAPPPTRFVENVAAPSFAALRAALERESLRRREPVVLSSVLVRSLESAIDGQAFVKAAVECLQRGSVSSTQMASLLFTATRAFRRAANLLPAERTLRSAGKSASSLAHRYTAQALLDASDVPGSDSALRGVAVTLARHAHSIDSSNVAVERYMLELNDRNRLEFGMQVVPSSNEVHITVRDDDDAETLNATQDDSTWHIVLPRPHAWREK